MQATRLLLIPLSIASLSVALVAACGGGKSYGASKYPTSAPAAVAAVVSPAASPTVVAVATATPVPPEPTSTAAPAPAAPPAAPAAVAPVANTPVPPPPAPTPTTVPAPPPPPPAPAAPAPATLSLTVANFSFTPNALTVKTGQTVTVNVSNSGPSMHTFSLQTGQSTGNISSGTSAALQFTAPSQAGTIAFRCMIHPSMTGQITVTN